MNLLEIIGEKSIYSRVAVRQGTPVGKYERLVSFWLENDIDKPEEYSLQAPRRAKT